MPLQIRCPLTHSLTHSRAVIVSQGCRDARGVHIVSKLNHFSRRRSQVPETRLRLCTFTPSFFLSSIISNCRLYPPVLTRRPHIYLYQVRRCPQPGPQPRRPNIPSYFSTSMVQESCWTWAANLAEPCRHPVANLQPGKMLYNPLGTPILPLLRLARFYYQSKCGGPSEMGFERQSRLLGIPTQVSTSPSSSMTSERRPKFEARHSTCR